MIYHVHFVSSIKSASSAGIRLHLLQASQSTQAFRGGKYCLSKSTGTTSKLGTPMHSAARAVFVFLMPSAKESPTT